MRKREKDNYLDNISFCPSVTIYTDGAFNKKHCVGGWGVFFIDDNNITNTHYMSGGFSNATSQKAELLAVIKAFTILPTPCKIHLISDSQYIVKGINEWLSNWKRNGWTNATGHQIKNYDMWKRIDKELERHNTKASWVKGHSGNKYNDIADQLAVDGKNNFLKENNLWQHH